MMLITKHTIISINYWYDQASVQYKPIREWNFTWFLKEKTIDWKIAT